VLFLEEEIAEAARHAIGVKWPDTIDRQFLASSGKLWNAQRPATM